MNLRPNPIRYGSSSTHVEPLARRLASLKQVGGSTLVEYALVITILMTMLLGIADFSRALYAYHFVSNTAREAARYAAVRGITCTNDNSCTAANSASGTAGATTQADIQAFVQNVPLGINAANVTATISWPPQANSPAICTNPLGPQINAPGCTVQVQVSYVFNFAFPFVSSTALTMNSTSQMIISH
jgi:Flp pilus assembly protein TadG